MERGRGGGKKWRDHYMGWSSGNLGRRAELSGGHSSAKLPHGLNREDDEKKTLAKKLY